jgi:hypothetical protein
LQTIGEDFCGLDVNTPLGGGEPVIERPVCTMNNVLLTAVAATSTGDFTVVFLGTSKGHLKKVFIIFNYISLHNVHGKMQAPFLFYLFDSNVNCETFFIFHVYSPSFFCFSYVRLKFKDGAFFLFRVQRSPCSNSNFSGGKKYLTSRFIFPSVNFFGRKQNWRSEGMNIHQCHASGLFDFVAQR